LLSVPRRADPTLARPLTVRTTGSLPGPVGLRTVPMPTSFQVLPVRVP
jgi:hypothetical protein